MSVGVKATGESCFKVPHPGLYASCKLDVLACGWLAALALLWALQPATLHDSASVLVMLMLMLLQERVCLPQHRLHQLVVPVALTHPRRSMVRAEVSSPVQGELHQSC